MKVAGPGPYEGAAAWAPAMAELVELPPASEPLRWVRGPGEPLAFELLHDDGVVARLQWRKPHGSLASAQTVRKTWSLKRSGFLNPVVSVRDGERPVARLTVHLHESRLELGGGRVFALRRAGLLVPAWHVLAPDATKLFDIEPVRDGRRLEGALVTAGPTPVGGDERALLIVLAWYFIVLAWVEDEALQASTQILAAASG